MKRRLLTVVTAVVALVVLTAAPAFASFGVTINQGSPGYVTNVDTRSIEGGVCGDPKQSISCSSSYDQIFVDKYKANTAPYAVAQNVQSTAYLYYYNSGTASWTQYLTLNEGTCRGLAGSGSRSCQFGSSASDVGTCPCTPAFYNLSTGGFSWTVVIRVNWSNASTGALLAQADYYPTSSSADIGCAGYAAGLGRCTGPYFGAKYNLRPPSTGVGYIRLS